MCSFIDGLIKLHWPQQHWQIQLGARTPLPTTPYPGSIFSQFHAVFGIFLATIIKHGFPFNEYALLRQALIALWISVGVDDWTVERAIIVSNLNGQNNRLTPHLLDCLQWTVTTYWHRTASNTENSIGHFHYWYQFYNLMINKWYPVPSLP